MSSSDSSNVDAAPVAIMLIDDDADCRALVRDAISELGQRFRVMEHDNGKDAIDFLFTCNDSQKPSVIFLDMEMPRLGGLETLEMIKTHPRLRNIPVVMLTGVSDDEYIRRAAQLGANSYTVKPTRVEDFIGTVSASANYWLRVHQHPNQLLPAIATSSAGVEKHEVRDSELACRHLES